MNRSFLIVVVPAALVAVAYFLLNIYAGVKLSYPRIAGSAVAFAVAVYLVHRYTQRKAKRPRADTFTMQVTEIFRSIQGEGTRAGLPCIFIRLTGCNLRCTWCDTAYSFYGGEKRSIEQIIARVDELAQPSPSAPKILLAEITGGEPLLQPDTPELARTLLREGYTVMIETSGERFVGTLPREVIKIIDVKCPDSGEPDTFDMANLAELSAEDEVKFVIASRRDYEFAHAFTSLHNLPARVKQVILQPVAADPAGKWPALEPRELAEWILADGAPVRMGLQLHKFIWDPAMRGV